MASMRRFGVFGGTMGAALVALALVGGGLATPASAQSSPFTAYGVDLEPGVVVEVFVRGASCGTATATAAGEWGPIYAGTEQCPASPGDEITFTLDGQPANETVEFVTGGAPDNVQTGISLTVAEEAESDESEIPSLGDLPAQGVALVQAPGGDMEALQQAAAASGCGLWSTWATVDGVFSGYTFNAPSFVNRGFEEHFPSGVPSGSPLILVCDPDALPA